ncbi:proton channel OtopLc-like [Ischnura elegans]|uniref:proton channel OtopLc-like n=1 Tax=Ischnura elegans TaxID=197161 RepID=UPI001ED8B189|nr:proton channel OtopLc-like [Ischnura elegans]
MDSVVAESALYSPESAFIDNRTRCDSVRSGKGHRVVRWGSRKWKREGNAALVATLSAFYGKLVVVLGVALPVTEAVAVDQPPSGFHDAFKLYLYHGSLFFLLFTYASLLREHPDASASQTHSGSMLRVKRSDSRQVRHGCFCLRAGVVAFGVGSVIYSGLEFGQYFELIKGPECSNVFLAINPLSRIVFTSVQMVFIFANNKIMALRKYQIVVRFGLMHMIATNMCEWLNALVQETKHDILHLLHNRQMEHEGVSSDAHLTKFRCRNTHIMASLLEESSPFLFPFTVEYSLLCAVILAVMWGSANAPYFRDTPSSHADSSREESGVSVIIRRAGRAGSRFSVDCASSYRGLFLGVLVLVLTLTSLLTALAMSRQQTLPSATVPLRAWELAVYAASALGAIGCMVRVRELHFQSERRLQLEHIILMVTQAGVYLYCLFQGLGAWLLVPDTPAALLLALTPVAAAAQSTCLTLALLDAWRRRCVSASQLRSKPGRQVISFLLVANVALWALNRLKNNRAELQPALMEFYGVWAWTIITRLCMPLVLCYRFHSTVCLYEVWKHAYKARPATE